MTAPTKPATETATGATPPGPAGPVAAHPTNAAITPKQITRGARVRGSDGGELGAVAHMQGPVTVMLEKDASGAAHYFPLSWVSRVDGAIHIDRTVAQAKKDWSHEPPPG